MSATARQRRAAAVRVYPLAAREELGEILLSVRRTCSGRELRHWGDHENPSESTHPLLDRSPPVIPGILTRRLGIVRMNCQEISKTGESILVGSLASRRFFTISPEDGIRSDGLTARRRSITPHAVVWACAIWPEAWKSSQPQSLNKT